MKRIVLSILLLAILFPNTLSASAVTYGDLLDELEKARAEKAEQDAQIAISEAEYDRISSEIKAAQNRIDSLNAKIIETQNEIVKLEEDIKEKKEETEKILVFLEVSNGESSYLEYIFKATSFTDFIHRVSIVEQISKYNDELIKEMNDMIKKNEDLKKELANNIEETEKERKNLQANLAKIGEKISDLYSEEATIDERIDAQLKIIAYYDDLGCSDRDDILAECSQVPPATGFLRPIPSGRVVDWYGTGDNPLAPGTTRIHSGVDVADGTEGQPVYAVADGRVAFTHRWSCGGNVVAVYHTVNGYKYTSIYMHLLEITVSPGDIVTSSDFVGYMGGRSTSTWYGGYDSCSTGAHVHLSMCYGHISATDPYRLYMFDPTNVIYFPSGWYSSRSW